MGQKVELGDLVGFDRVIAGLGVREKGQLLEELSYRAGAAVAPQPKRIQPIPSVRAQKAYLPSSRV